MSVTIEGRGGEEGGVEREGEGLARLVPEFGACLPSLLPSPSRVSVVLL